jgi:hypothetical protein
MTKRKSDKRKWMDIDTAVAYLMKGGYTRQQAMDLLAAKVEGGEVEARKISVPLEERLATQQQIDNEPDKVGLGLGEFITRFGLDPDDVRAELAAGRLCAYSNSSVAFSSIVGEDVPADHFFVSKQAIEDWVKHPQTPAHMIMQACEAIDKKPNAPPRALVIRRGGGVKQ